MRPDRGTILLSVLWIIAILTIISFSLAAAVRVEMSSLQNTFDGERAELLAKAGAWLLYSNILSKQNFPDDSPVHAENGEYVFQLNSGEVRVGFDSYASRIDINAASVELLESVLDHIGVSAQDRPVIVDSILDWRDTDDERRLNGAESADYNFMQPPMPGIMRPRNGPFATIDELGYVNGITPEVLYGGLARDPITGAYRRVPGLRDIFTVDSGSSTVDPNYASASVLQVLPSVDDVMADRIVAERAKKRFESMDDLASRVPDLALSGAVKNFELKPALATIIISKGTLFSSGISRTVRLFMRRQDKKPANPGGVVESEMKFVRWVFE